MCKKLISRMAIVSGCLASMALAVPKPHVVAFGKWTAAKWYVGAEEKKSLELKIRPLYVDTRLKEYTTGVAHEITNRLFVVGRVFRMNDVLPTEAGSPRWQWQRGGWLLIDHVTGRVTQLTLPDFDPFYSTPSWYRDYVAYCGVLDDGKKLFAVVAQLGRRKPILRKSIGDRMETTCRIPNARRRSGSASPPRSALSRFAGTR